MVRRPLGALDPAPESLLFIENVGNLVCPLCSISVNKAKWS